MKKTLVLIPICLAMLSTGAVAQDVVVMRRTIAEPAARPDGVWVQGGWTYAAGAPTCSDSIPQTQSVTCQSGGRTVGDSHCTGTKPPTARTSERTEGCTTEWRTSGYGDYDSHCTAAARRTQSVTCQRSDGKPLDDSKCSGSKPPATDPVTPQLLDGCSSVDWNVGDWSTYSSYCSLAATRTRPVACHGQKDASDTGFTVTPDTECTKAKPSATDVPTKIATGCTSFAWGTPGPWTNVSGQPACTSSTAQTRYVPCIRQLDQEVVDQSYCTAPSANLGDPTRQTAADYSGCTGTWAAGTTWSDASACTSGFKTQTRDDTCRSSTGTVLADTSTCNPTTRPAGYSKQVSCTGTCNNFVGSTKLLAAPYAVKEVFLNSVSGTQSQKVAAARKYCEALTAQPNFTQYKYLIACYIYNSTSVYGYLGISPTEFYAAGGSTTTNTNSNYTFSTCTPSN